MNILVSNFFEKEKGRNRKGKKVRKKKRQKKKERKQRELGFLNERRENWFMAFFAREKEGRRIGILERRGVDILFSSSESSSISFLPFFFFFCSHILPF